MYRIYEVCEDQDIADYEVAFKINPEEAQSRQADIQLGDTLQEPIEDEMKSNCRTPCASSIMRSVRRVEQMKIVKGYRSRIGEIITGEVKRVTRDGVFVDLGSQIEAVALRDELIGREILRPGDRIRAYFMKLKAMKNTIQACY